MRYFWMMVLILALFSLGCDALTREEAKAAVEEIALANQATIMVGGSIELSTNFTLGQALDAAATELAAFVESQLPCAQVTISANTVDIQYGALGGACTYNGQSWSGRHTVTIVAAADGAVQVNHEWVELSNGVMSVSGTAEVTWSAGFAARHVVHDLHWTRVYDGREGVGTGDRLQEPLGGAWTTGIVVNGEREWDGKSGNWQLEIDNVEARWVDPVPQSGKYKLDTPFGKSATVTFERVDADRIKVTIKSGKKSFSFNVSRLGAIEKA